MKDDKFYYDLDDLGAWLAVNVMGMIRINDRWHDARTMACKTYLNWDPLHNDAQACMVLDKMCELWGTNLEKCEYDSAWWAQFYRQEPKIIQAQQADTRAEAICRAAKAAIEAQRAQKKPRPHTCNATPDFCEFVGGIHSWRLEIKCEGHRTSSGLVRDECPFCGEKL